MKLTKSNMPETMYRASRCCRALGNPSAYLLLRCLGKDRKTPSMMAEETGVSLAAVSMTLRHLRDLDLVRYETAGRHKHYWIKDNGVIGIMDEIESLVESLRRKD